MQSRHAPGFFGTLFDFSFTHFVYPKIVRFIYILAVANTAIFTLYCAILLVVHAFRESVALGITVLLFGVPLGAPLVFLGLTLCVRIYLELLIVLFRIAEDVSRLAEAPLGREEQTQAGPMQQG